MPPTSLKQKNDLALRELALNVKLLAEGKCICLLRKHAPDDPPDEEEKGPREFFLFPNYSPPNPAEFKPTVQQDLGDAMSSSTGMGMVRFSVYAAVRASAHLTSKEALRAVQDEHPWTWDAAEERFEREPRGQHLWIVRAFRLSTPLMLVARPMYDGSPRWVTLEGPLATRDAVVVLPDAAFERRVAAIRGKLTGA